MKQYIKPAARQIDITSEEVFALAAPSQEGIGSWPTKGTDWIEDDFDDSDDGWGW